MHFVYFFAALILVLTLIKFTLEGKIAFPKNWVFLSLLVFVIFQIIPAFTSIDKFTSVAGYPSRLNGGLLSQFAYLVIFTCALINLDVAKAKKTLATLVLSALAVSLWGIPGHFGYDPSCYVLTGKLTSACWQKEFDPQVRIFSTMGQPNWLASYLVLVLPFSVYFVLIVKRLKLKIFFLATALILFTALIMTTSRAGLSGLLVGSVLLTLLLLLHSLKTLKQNFLWLGIFAAGLILITAFFGGFLFSRIQEALLKNQKTINQPATNYQLPATSLGGTESGTIRLIVWKGAVEAFKHRPILGFGPETFAYSYYLFRPQEHNKTTEWNFFYNKAHNEFLNYLAGIGAVGTSLYFAFLVITLMAFYKLIRKSKEESAILLSAGFASVAGYQTSIFFGFSTVTSQLIFYLTIALVLIYANSQKLATFKLNFPSQAKYITSSLLVIIGIFCLAIPIRFFLADLLIARAKQGTSVNISQAVKDYESGVNIFPFKNPFYLADNAYAQAIYATGFEDKNVSQNFAERSSNLIQQSLNLAPNNLIVARRAANAFFILAEENNEYGQKALDVGRKLTELAPTDPQSYYTLAQIQAGVGKTDEAKKTLETALSLKADYLEAQELLKQLTFDN